ncbi:MAG: hypothetical protein OXE53_05380 [Deltaproteobacteria bacterium]|nr:hypothetical protein [Deltaproteobacteria bacterium]
MRIQRLGVVSCAALVALVLTGCGGGGKMTTSGTPGDESEMSLLQKWQRFADGSPTLSMTGEEIEEAWTAVAERTTRYVSLSHRIPVPCLPPADCEPQPPDEVIEVVAERIEYLELLERFEGGVATDIEVVYAPVLEHNGIPVAELKYRYTYEDEPRRYLSDVLSYGGGLGDTTFRVDFDRRCEVGAAGCSGVSPDFMDALINRTVTGRYSESTPTGVGSATWTGVMVGMRSPVYPHYPGDPHYPGYPGTDLIRPLPTPVAQPDAYVGDARIMIDNLACPNVEVDVSFTNLHNVTEGAKHRDMTWENLRVKDGLFRSRNIIHNADDYIIGMFSGPQHQEVGGKFGRHGIAGVFGAKRQ